MITVKAEIRRVSDGEVRVHEEQYQDDDGEACAYYLWTDGNYGCDCNRQLFWLRADGQEAIACQDGGPCTTGRYMARLSIGDEVLLDEWKDGQAA